MDEVGRRCVTEAIAYVMCGKRVDESANFYNNEQRKIQVTILADSSTRLPHKT